MSTRKTPRTLDERLADLEERMRSAILFMAGGTGALITFDATSPSTQDYGDAAFVGAAATAPHRDHKHAMPAIQMIKAGSFTSSAAAGTRTTHAHGRSYTPTIAIPVATGANDDANNAKASPVVVVSIDAANVVVKSAVVSVPFDLYVGR